MHTPTLTICIVFSFLAVSRSLFLEYPVTVREIAKKENTIHIVKVGVYISFINICFFVYLKPLFIQCLNFSVAFVRHSRLPILHVSSMILDLINL